MIRGVLLACLLAPIPHGSRAADPDAPSSATLAGNAGEPVVVSTEKRPNLPRRVWEEARARHRGAGPPLLIVDPKDGETYASERVRFGGCTEPGSEVTVNGMAAHVYSSGAFVGMTPLRAGKNSLAFRSTLKGKSTTIEMRVFRPEPPKPLPKTPLRILTGGSFLPDSDLELLPKDVLRVRCQGSPGARAWFRIGWSRKRYEMRELPLGTGGATIPGVYEGVYVIETDDDYVQAAIAVTLEATAAGRKKTVSVRAKGRLTTDPDRVRRFALVTEDDSGLYTDLTTAVRVTSASKGTPAELDGRREDFRRVRLGGTEHAWIYSKNIQFAAKKKPPRPRFQEAILEEDAATSGGAVLSILLDCAPAKRESLPPLPFRVETSDAAPTLTLTLWGLSNAPRGEKEEPAPEPFPIPAGVQRVLTALDADWRSTGTLVRSVRRVPSDEETSVVEVGLRTARSWGYDATFERGVLKLRLKPAPKILDVPDRPLAGLKIFLDAGHGGKDVGAVGPGGLRESDANLEIAERLAVLLERAGAQVEKTRTNDQAVSLEERIERVARSGADLFLSIHNNSVSLSRNPLDVSGPLLFYYHGHGAELAGRVYNALTEETGFPRQPARVQPHWFRPMRLCPQMPSALAEVLFLCNPEDEMLLVQPAFLDNVSVGLYKGIADFFQRRPFPLADAVSRPEDSGGAQPAKSEDAGSFPQVAQGEEQVEEEEKVGPGEDSIVDSLPLKKAGPGKVRVAPKSGK